MFCASNRRLCVFFKEYGGLSEHITFLLAKNEMISILDNRNKKRDLPP